MAIIEPIMMMLGPQITTYDQLGTVQRRLGNRSVNNAPRNVYRTADGQWVAVQHLVAVDRRTRDAPRRASRADRRAVVRHRPAAGRARRRAGRGGRGMDRGAARWPRCSLPSPRRRQQSDRCTTSAASMSDPQYAALGTVATRSTTTSSVPSRCRTCCSGCPDPGIDPLGRTAARGRHDRGPRRDRRRRPTQLADLRGRGIV